MTSALFQLGELLERDEIERERGRFNRLACEISRNGLHWDELDEDISIAGLLAGQGDRTKPRSIAA